MRLQGFLTEKIISPENVIKILVSSCQPFLKEIKNGRNGFLYRGKNSYSAASIERFSSRIDRKPKDMSALNHDILDELFEKKFGWKSRSEGVFCSGHPSIAARYGSIYIFFPIGEYKYLWSPEIKDLFDRVRMKSWSWLEKGTREVRVAERLENLRGMVDTYKDNDLKEAMYSGNEISVKCKTFYLVDLSVNYLMDRLQST